MKKVKNIESGKNNQNYDYNDFFRMYQQYLRTSQLIIDKIPKLKKVSKDIDLILKESVVIIKN